MAAVSAADPYYKAGEAALARQLTVVPNTGRAKNVILFLGDGMGISTVTAGRIYDGQQKGVDGESNSLAFEKLSYAALSKTYSHDTQVTDSAAGITAIMSGVKTRNKIIGLTGAADATLAEALPAGPVALVLGAEGEGMRQNIESHCDALAKLPIGDQIESLNVSNAAAIALYAVATR